MQSWTVTRISRLRWLPVALLLTPVPALANGRFPAASQFLTSQPERLALRATFGLLVSADQGASWEWICEEAMGFNGNQDPAVAITPQGSLLAGLAEGLSVSQNGGCAWSFAAEGLEHQLVIDVAVRRAAPSAAYALTSTLTSGDGGAPAFRSQLFVSRDDGRAWQPVGAPFDPAFRAETIEVAESDAARLYVSGVRGGGSSAKGVLFSSGDGGMTWQERPIALETPQEKAPFLAAVDPADPERLYVRTAGVASGRLLVSTDGGESFRVLYTSRGPLLGFALSPDGTTIFVGGPLDGLLAASKAEERFESRASIEVQCLATQGDSIWACSNDTTSFLLGVSRDGGRTFEAKVRLAAIKGPLVCGVPAQPAGCGARWPDLRTRFAAVAGDGGAGSADAGARDAPSDVPTGQAPSSKGGGCALSPGPAGSARQGLVLLSAIAACALALRRIRNRSGRDLP
jgi:photosystem II stability/assembly factor-like uncharacterized protein